MRRDGRNANQIRPVSCELGALNRADGSARFCYDKTAVLVAVYGPVDVKASKEIMDHATIEVVYKTKIGFLGCAGKALEGALQQSVESLVLSSLHPRTSIQIVVQLLEDDGSVFACAINAICLALIDAGIPLKTIFAACSCALMADVDNQLILDPTKEEEIKARAVLSFGGEQTKNVIGISLSFGQFTEAEYFQSAQACRITSEHIFAFIRLSLQRKLSKEPGNE